MVGSYDVLEALWDHSIILQRLTKRHTNKRLRLLRYNIFITFLSISPKRDNFKSSCNEIVVSLAGKSYLNKVLRYYSGFTRKHNISF